MHTYTFDPKRHEQFYYCQNVHSFQKARFAYYLNKQPVSCEAVTQLFLDDEKKGILPSVQVVDQALARISNYNPDVFIVTATKNRKKHLRNLLRSIQQQQFSQRVAWIIIENGSSDGTTQLLEQWSKIFPWVTYLSYNTAFGYAAPARNRGLALIQLATRHVRKNQFVWTVDSDDILNNEFALHELHKEALKGGIMTHGFSVTRYEDNHGELITVNTIPRDIGKNFPHVPSLKDEFEMGPQVLSAFLPTLCIPYFYYPDEFTMEDDTLNQRIMVWSRLRGERINPIHFPCLTKTFHFNSMAGTNDQVGDENIQVQLGPKIVTGIRAQAVLGLLHIRDYYTREGI